MEDWTLGSVLNTLLIAAGALSVLATAASQIVSLWKKAKAPNQKQDDRLKDLEKKAEQIDTKLDNDNRRIMAQVVSTRLILRALLALLDHGLNGNNVEQMAAAQKAVQEHLINQ